MSTATDGPESDVDLLIVSDGGPTDDGPVVNEVMWEGRELLRARAPR